MVRPLRTDQGGHRRGVRTRTQYHDPIPSISAPESLTERCRAPDDVGGIGVPVPRRDPLNVGEIEGPREVAENVIRGVHNPRGVPVKEHGTPQGWKPHGMGLWSLSPLSWRIELLER